MGKYFNDEMPTIDNLPTLIIKEENCHDMNKLEKCAVKELETCKESTPANLVEALFRFVRKETPCGKFKERQPGNGGDALKSPISCLLGVSLMVLIAKFMSDKWTIHDLFEQLLQ